jgi:gamma-glutamylcyclotransferase (GGCT)/AIG2-like uncharacterized protein YtfP
VLRDHEIPTQAVGGLAVRAWGGSRPLVDLDFYVPDRCLRDAARSLADWAVGEPHRIRCAHWDLTVLLLDVDGRRVELGGADTGRYRDAASGRWCPAAVDFSAGVAHAVLGVPVTVMALAPLVTYKSALQREVDLVDLHELTGSGGAVETRLAVYGTLAPGQANHGAVADLRGSWTGGVVHGHLHPTGWGVTYGFPALAWHPDASAVTVQLLTSPDLPAAWDRLDRFEGEAYQRILVPVTTDTGRIIANIYVARRSV